MFGYLRALFYREPKWSDPKAQRWATLFQKRARRTGQLPDEDTMKKMGLGPDHRFWKQDNRNPRKGFAVNFDIPLSPFIDGTEDEMLKSLEGRDDFGVEVSVFPIGATGKRLKYEFTNRLLDVPFESQNVTTKTMVEVCCGLLTLRILPRLEEFSIPAELDFRKAHLKRIVWDAVDEYWEPIFEFEDAESVD